MTTTTASDLTVPLIGGRLHFLLRRLHSLTGILFGGYIIVHLLVNATLLEGVRHEGGTGAVTGPTVFQVQVDKIHSLPFLEAVEWTFIYIPLIYHALYGLWIVFTGQPNVGRYAYGKNWAYFAQRVSAVLLLLFIAFHVLTMKGVFGGETGRALTFDPLNATQTAYNHFHASPIVTWVVYPLGILCGTFHLANGFWTAAITWGLTISAGSQKRWGAVCVLLFLFTTGCGFAAWGAAVAGTPKAASETPLPSRGDAPALVVPGK